MDKESSLIEKALADWQLREAHLRKIFSSSANINRLLLSEKLRYYNYVSLNFKSTANIEERVMLRIIKSEKKSMLLELYPKIAVRFFKNAISKLFDTPRTARSYARQELVNLENLANQLQLIGFKETFINVERHIMNKEDRFSVMHTGYRNEKECIECKLDFEKKSEGKYQFEGLTAVLKNDHKPTDEISHYFKIGEQQCFTLKEVYNLLSGRAVMQNQIWKQFDLNDKLTTGSYRIKEFKPDCAFDPERLIQNLPLKESINEHEIKRVIDDLSEGSRAPVNLVSEDGQLIKCYIQADPQFKSLHIFDTADSKTMLKLKKNSGSTTDSQKKMNETKSGKMNQTKYRVKRII